MKAPPKFKKGDRVIVTVECDSQGYVGTVLGKSLSPDRTIVLFDKLPNGYGHGDEPVECDTRTSILELEHVLDSPLFQELK